jgi:nitrogenase-stabilizing/protective protein
LDTLRRLGSAEEILSYFRISFDQRVVDVYRMRILKEASGFLNHLGPHGTDDDELYARFRAFLHDVYRDAAERNGAGSPPAEHQDRTHAVGARPSSTFVPLEAVVGINRPKRS